MNKRYKIAIDAMGGDNAPGVVVEGALAALQEKDDFEVIFVGDCRKASKIQEAMRTGYCAGLTRLTIETE